LIGTVPDVSRWIRALSINQNRILSEQYFLDNVLNTNNYTNVYDGSTQWNLGVGLGFDQDENTFFHLGNIEGYACHAVYSINEGVAVSVCLNGHADVKTFPYEVLSAIFPYRQ
jgi:hypothetical protein